jgi:hypothetical protein
MRVLTCLAVVLLLSGCWMKDLDAGTKLLVATPEPGPGMAGRAGLVVDACPSLLTHLDQVVLYAAESRPPSVTAQREIAADVATTFPLQIKAGYAGNEHAAGERCEFEAAAREGHAAVIVSKTACVRLCDDRLDGDFRVIKPY